MHINTPENTITASRDEMNTILDKALDRKLSAMPDRSAIHALSANGPQGDRVQGLGYSDPTKPYTLSPNPFSHEREKILKTFRFFHALSENDHAELRSIMQTYEPEYIRTLALQTEASGSVGGYLVPPEFYADVLFLLNEYGFARKYCSQIQMNSSTLNVSTLTGKPSVAWVTEAGTITSSKPTFGQLTLTAQKLAALYPISNELLQDANIDVYNTIVRLFVEVFGAEEDTQVFRGTGSPFSGLLNTAGVTTTYLGGSSTSGKTKFTDITLDDLIDLVQSVGPAQQRDAVLFIEQNTLTELLKKKDLQSRYLWDIATSNDPEIAGANGMSTANLRFHGYPVVALPNGVLIDGYDTDAHPETPFAAFGNLRTAGCWFGLRGGMEIRISHDATSEDVNAFTNDLQFLRVTERIAFGVGQPANLAVLSTSVS